LKKELKVSTGTIYHHLETLSDLVEQQNDKKYYLTELGVYAYNSLKDNIETIKSPDFAHRELKTPILRKLMWVTSQRFIQFAKEDKLYVILISLVIIICGTILSGLNSFYSFLLYFIEIEYYQILFSFSFILNFLIFFAVVEVISRLFFRKNTNSLKFFLSSAIIQFPMIFYLILHFILKILNLLDNNFASFFDKFILIVFQVWSLWLLSYSLCVNKGLKIESSLIFSVLLHYGGFTLILFLLI